MRRLFGIDYSVLDMAEFVLFTAYEGSNLANYGYFCSIYSDDDVINPKCPSFKMMDKSHK